MAIRPEQPQSIGGVLDTAFTLFKSSIGVVWPICLLLALAGAPPAIYLFTKGGAGVLNSSDPFSVLSTMSQPGYMGANLLSMILSLWCFGALFLKMHAVGTDTELSVGAALQLSLGRVVPLFFMTILLVIAIILGVLLLIVPGLILTISLLLCWSLLLFENQGPVAALTGSHHLVWGNWWRTAAVLTVGFLIVMVLYAAVGMLVGLLLPLVGGIEDFVMFGLVTSLLVAVLGNVLLTPFYSALLIAVYWDLKLRKQGGDLAARVSALGTAS